MESLSTDRRRRPRISTMILCEVRVGAKPPQLVRIRDLSECGIRIATALKLLPGEHVRVRLPGAGDWVMARVAWRTPSIAGLAFLRAIDLPQIANSQALLKIAGGPAVERARLVG